MRPHKDAPTYSCFWCDSQLPTKPTHKTWEEGDWYKVRVCTECGNINHFEANNLESSTLPFI